MRAATCSGMSGGTVNTWLGARITGPLGTSWLSIPRARYAVSAAITVAALTTS